MYNTFFVKEFNNRKRDILWNKDEHVFKRNFRFKLGLLIKIVNMDKSDIPENYMVGEFYRLSLGYRGIGKNSGFASGIESLDAKKVSSNQTTRDHLVGTTEVGKFIHEQFKKYNYDIEYMVNTWLYEHLFLWATIKITKEEHHKDNILRNSKHSIEQKLNLEHYINVSELV